LVLEEVCVLRSKWQGFGYADGGSLLHIKSVLSQEVRLRGWRRNYGRIFTKDQEVKWTWGKGLWDLWKGFNFFVWRRMDRNRRIED